MTESTHDVDPLAFGRDGDAVDVGALLGLFSGGAPMSPEDEARFESLAVKVNAALGGLDPRTSTDSGHFHFTATQGQVFWLLNAIGYFIDCAAGSDTGAANALMDWTESVLQVVTPQAVTA